MHNNIITKPSRVGTFDLLRIILIVLVVNLHIRIIAYSSPNLLERFVFYAVPLFLVLSFYFMSKYLMKERVPHKIILSRIKRISVPLLFWSAMGFVVHPELI